MGSETLGPGSYSMPRCLTAPAELNNGTTLTRRPNICHWLGLEMNWLMTNCTH